MQDSISNSKEFLYSEICYLYFSKFNFDNFVKHYFLNFRFDCK